MSSTPQTTKISTITGRLTTASGSLKKSVRRVPLPSLRLTVSERRLFLAIVDMLALSSALLAALVLHGPGRFSWDLVVQQPRYYLLLIGIWMISALFFDCYDLARTADASHSAWAAGRAALVTALAYLAVPYLTPDFLTSRLSSLLFVGFVTATVPIWRVFYAVVFSQPVFQKRVLVIGAGQSSQKISDVLARIPEHGNPYAGSGCRLVGIIDVGEDLVGTQIEGVPVLGVPQDLTSLVKRHDIDLLVIALRHAPTAESDLFQALLDCRELGVDMELMTGLYERLTGRLLVEHAGRDFDLIVPIPDSAIKHFFRAGKRIVDLIAGVCGLLILALLAPFIALANAIWSPGPLFYRQLRVGKGGKPFHIYKLRSMIPTAEENCGAVWSSQNDSRITPVGKLLRKSRLDEFPQFLNVLKGDMSLVGPRPERPEFIAELVKEIPFYQARHAVRPGVTGWAQVRYRYGCSLQDALVKLEYDLYYIRHQGLYLELSILVKTLAVMLGLKGR